MRSSAGFCLLLAASCLGAGMALPQAARAASDDATIVLPVPFSNIDACNISSESGIISRENIVETLTQLDPVDSSPKPRLALSWQQTGPLTWRVVLRQGVKFHDGASFDSKALAAAVDRMLDPKLECLDRLRYMRDVGLTVTVVDDHTVDLGTKTPQPLMPVLMAYIGVGSPNSPRTLSREPVGTGPFRIAGWRGDQQLTVQRFDGYWGEKPALARATYLWRAEPALRAAMVQVGEADVALAIAATDATDKQTDFAYQNGETTRLRFVMTAPLDDIRVRRAMNLAIDREGLRDGLFTKDFQIATQFFVPRIAGYNPDLKPWRFDPAEAKRLLAAAKADGVPVDREIVLIARIGFFPQVQEAMEAMIQMWSDVGLKVRLRMMDRAEWLKLVNKPFAENRGPTLIQEQHDNTTGDASFTMNFRYRSDGQQSEIAVPALDRILDQANAASGEERRKLFQEANRMAAEDIVPDVLMFYMVNYIRIAPRLDFRPTNVNSTQLELSDIHVRN
ncbi:ABC transporter substrate-binding protein [Roseomonas elaeocarpi]|uniref:ABC transporter substrate-binding protein n=1 Tax=Roseomonas elaeocarpi TaxID=907779 RepID=A0ABV6K2L5_9PROT